MDCASPVLKGRAAHDLGFRAGVLDDIQSGPVTDQLAVLAGPRRIGKSVTVLDTAAALCARREIDARQIIYLTCGGFPRAVAEHTRIGAVSTAYLNDLRSWLRADVDPDRPQDSVPRLLDCISQRAASPLSITATSTALSYPSRDIFVRRLNRLVSSHAAIWCPRREEEQAVPGAQAKLYLTDPLLASLPSRLRTGLPRPDMTRLTEMTIGVALARTIDDLEEGRWVTGDTIGYVRTSGEHQVDLGPVTVPSANGPAVTVPLESKWVEQGWKGAARTIDGKYGRGILATKSVLDTTGNTWAVPAPLLALLLQ
jgi:predicted AAA+ superfamily ATPase